jgi:hypothetical protein
MSKSGGILKPKHLGTADLVLEPGIRKTMDEEHSVQTRGVRRSPGSWGWGLRVSGQRAVLGRAARPWGLTKVPEFHVFLCIRVGSFCLDTHDVISALKPIACRILGEANRQSATPGFWVKKLARTRLDSGPPQTTKTGVTAPQNLFLLVLLLLGALTLTETWGEELCLCSLLPEPLAWAPPFPFRPRHPGTRVQLWGVSRSPLLTCVAFLFSIKDKYLQWSENVMKKLPLHICVKLHFLYISIKITG